MVLTEIIASATFKDIEKFNDQLPQRKKNLLPLRAPNLLPPGVIGPFSLLGLCIGLPEYKSFPRYLEDLREVDSGWTEPARS